MLSLFIFLHAYGAAATALWGLWAAPKERSCVEFCKLFISPRKSFNGPLRRAVFASFRELWRALCVIVRLRFAECSPLGHDGSRRCYARRGGLRRGIPEEQVLREARRARRAFPSVFALYPLSARIARCAPLMPRSPLYNMHYPIIVEMTKVSRANRARATPRWYAFASGIRARISSANIITPATL